MPNLIRKTPYLFMSNHLFACESTNFHKIIISRVVKKLYQSKFGITPSDEMPFKSILIIFPVCDSIKQHNFIVSTLGETMDLLKNAAMHSWLNRKFPQKHGFAKRRNREFPEKHNLDARRSQIFSQKCGLAK